MSLDLTLALTPLFLTLTIAFAVLGARPAKPLSRPRLIPWRLMMLFAFAGMVALLVHLVAMLRSGPG
ncbi:MAG TPA: hypothetical protein VGS12_16455 [Caulobacteraceae bacterium]|nr:hypothetical protein [Caulobacteraceae bacterium]